MTSYIKSSVSGVYWSLLEKYGIQGFNVLFGIFLARILDPSDFGIIGIVSVLNSLALVLSNSGLGTAYIQSSNVDSSSATSIFYFNALISLLFFSIFFFASPAISIFYDQPKLELIIKVSSLVIVLSSFGMMHMTILVKELDFKLKSLIMLVGTIVSGIGATVLALLGYGVWSLVFQQLILNSIVTVLLWIFVKWRPSFNIDIRPISNLFSFGVWVLLSNVFKSIFDNLNTLFIGKYFPISQLGFYNRAKGYQRIVCVQPMSAIGQVSFSTFSQLKKNKTDLKNIMIKFLRNSVFLISILCSILLVVAEPLIRIVLTEKWMGMVVYFKLLLLIGFAYPINVLNIQLLLSQGYSKFNFNITVFKNTIRILNILIMFRFGVYFIVLGEVVIAYMELLINSWLSMRILRINIFNQIKAVGSIFLSVLISIPIGIFVSSRIESSLMELFLGSIVTFMSFVLVQYLINREFILSVKRKAMYSYKEILK